MRVDISSDLSSYAVEIVEVCDVQTADCKVRNAKCEMQDRFLGDISPVSLFFFFFSLFGSAFIIVREWNGGKGGYVLT